MRFRYPALVSLLGAAVVAGCGGSNNPDTAHVRLPPSVSQTMTFTPTTTSTTSTTQTITTPKTGALSKEPTITPPKGSPPKTLQTKDLVTGTGATAAAGDTVTVNYVGALYTNGKVFDSSWSRSTTYTTPLATTSVIPGWVEGIPGMRVGGRRELIIPPALAYKNLSESGIPPNSTLIFIVDLLGVTPAGGSSGG
jgi:peptidylprolyl isomerase